MSSRKAPGIDGIPPEVLKDGESCLMEHLHKLFCTIWEQETVPQDFRDGLVVHINKRKGDWAVCDNHRGISLLSTAGKVLARVLLNRLNSHVNSNTLFPKINVDSSLYGRGTSSVVNSTGTCT